jgi:hypothetical protein
MSAGVFESCSLVSTLLPVIPRRGVGCVGTVLATVLLPEKRSAAIEADDAVRKVRRSSGFVIFNDSAGVVIETHPQNTIKGGLRRCSRMP